MTGSTGLVGMHLMLDLLKQGEPVRALKRSSSNLEMVQQVFRFYSPENIALFQRIEWIETDILDVPALYDAMEGVTHVYHCAALVSFNSKDIEQLEKINVEGTANVVNVALERQVKKLCHVSSTAAIGKGTPDQILDEKQTWKNGKENSDYANSKHGAEREVWRGIEEGLEAVIVNPSIIIGPGDWNKGSCTVFKTAYKGLKFYTEGTTAFVDVRDVVKTMIALMESPLKTERYLVFSENLTFRTFFKHLAVSLGKKPASIKASKFLTELGWRFLLVIQFLTGKAAAITKDSSRAAHRTYNFSNAKVKAAVDIDFIPIEQSIKDASKFYLHGLRKGDFH